MIALGDIDTPSLGAPPRPGAAVNTGPLGRFGIPHPTRHKIKVGGIGVGTP
jgi:hypothetical protein